MSHNPKIPSFNLLRDLANKAGVYAKLDEQPSSSRLWIVFSHIDIPSGKFAQTNVFKNIEGNKLFLNCARNSWYAKGISGFSSSIKETIEKLAPLNEAFDVAYVGHSMGAYLSAQCGLQTPQVTFLATSPELKLGLSGTRSRAHNVKSKQGPEIQSSYADKSNGLILFGAYDPIDCLFLSETKKLNELGCVHEVPHHHGVTEYLTSNNIYVPLLNSLSGNKHYTSVLTRRRQLFPIYSFGSAEQYKHFFDTYNGFTHDNYQVSRLKNNVGEFSEWSNPGWQDLRSKVLESIGDFDGALLAAKNAYLAERDIIEYAYNYGVLSLKADHKEIVFGILDSFKSFHRRHQLGQMLSNAAREKYGVLYRPSKYNERQDLAHEEQLTTADHNTLKNKSVSHLAEAMLEKIRAGEADDV